MNLRDVDLPGNLVAWNASQTAEMTNKMKAELGQQQEGALKFVVHERELHHDISLILDILTS